MTKFKIVYTISNNKRMESDLKDSIDSALEFVNPNDIVVISTPPHDYPFLDTLKEKANLDIRLKNYTEAWRLHPTHLGEQPKRYGEKLLLTTIGFRNIIFLDCDTYIYNDPTILFEEDYDFGGAAIDTPSKEDTPWQMRHRLLEKTIKEYNLGLDSHIWNGGHLIFRNFLHIKLQDIWLKYFNDKERLHKLNSTRYTDDQLSLTPALAEIENIKIKCFDKDKIFKVGWYKRSWYSYKFPKTVCIFHGDELKEHLDAGRKRGLI